MNDSGIAVKKVLDHYKCNKVEKQLIVVFDDMNTLPGAVVVQGKFLFFFKFSALFLQAFF